MFLRICQNLPYREENTNYLSCNPLMEGETLLTFVLISLSLGLTLQDNIYN